MEAPTTCRSSKSSTGAIWSTGGCKSWYLDPNSGKNTTLWPGFTWRFRQAAGVFRASDYDMTRTHGAALPLTQKETT